MSKQTSTSNPTDHRFDILAWKMMGKGWFVVFPNNTWEQPELRRSCFRFTFAERVNAVNDYLERAIEQARAEWQAVGTEAEIDLAA